MVSLENLYAIYQQHPVVCTDTRQLSSGCIFFALKGDNFDGNTFAANALEQGAAYVVIDDPAHQTDSDRCILVSDVLETLQQLAHYHRQQFDIPIIAIGGSNGKTTTKELVASVLSSYYPCHYTTGNFNNHIGVPLTLLAMPAKTEVAVIEMGTNQPGDIELLCEVTAPTHGLLTNIGKEHLAGFGDLVGVKKEEGELYAYLARNKGCAFVNATEPHLSDMSAQNPQRVFYCASEVLEAQDGVIDVRLVGEDPYLEVAFLSETNEEVAVKTQLIGSFNFQNIMTAIALGVYFKVPADRIKAAIEQYQPANNRSQVQQDGSNTVFLDAYNANPSSMRAVLETLNRVPAQHKVAILGDMLELGDKSLQEHQAVVDLAIGYNFDFLVLVGPEFGKCNRAGTNAVHFPDTVAAKAWYDSQVFDQAFILIKASRGIRLERILST